MIFVKGVNSMAWVNTKKTIPITNPLFQEIVCGLVFNCPSSNEFRERIGVNERGNPKYRYIYKPVSAREVSFRNRGIDNRLFETILAQIRRPLNNKKTYALIDKTESVELTVHTINSSVPLKDPYYEMIVFQKRSDMSNAEALYYYLRNAFAHGSFEVVPTDNGNVYLLESSKDGNVKAQMRLKESSLIEYIRLANLTAGEIRRLQRRRKKNMVI